MARAQGVGRRLLRDGDRMTTTTFAHVVDGVVRAVGLPSTGTLSDGSSVSGFSSSHLMSLSTEGWLPVMEIHSELSDGEQWALRYSRLRRAVFALRSRTDPATGTLTAHGPASAGRRPAGAHRRTARSTRRWRQWWDRPPVRQPDGSDTPDGDSVAGMSPATTVFCIRVVQAHRSGAGRRIGRPTRSRRCSRFIAPRR